MSYPPTLHPVPSDTGAVSAALTTPGGNFVAFLNATPKQGGESLANWSRFRISHLLEDDARSATLDASAHGLAFRGGRGTCVMDDYVTRVGAHRFRELACLVAGPKGGSVIVAAAPVSGWDRVSSTLEQAVDAYVVH